MLRSYVSAFALFAAVVSHGAAQDARSGLITLYDFKASSGDASQPNSAMVIGKSGIMLGVSTQGGASNKGSVYSMTPPPFKGDPWSEQILYSFQGGAQGLAPLGPLVIQGGNLYGVASGGSITCGINTTTPCGIVFELQPPAIHGEPWRKKAIYSFGPLGANGWSPAAGLTPGPNGVLYGTAQYGPGSPKTPCADGCGTVFSLTPPATQGKPWTIALIYSFQGQKDGAHPQSPVVIDANGVLYGTSLGGDPRCSFGCGTVYSLTPPSTAGGAWTHTVLHLFTKNKPVGGLTPGAVVLGKGGILYGTTGSGGSKNFGTVFSLRPPAKAGAPWTEKLVYSFTNGMDGASPFSGLAIGASQALYGTTYQGGDTSCTQAPNLGCGTAYQLKPPTSPGGSWTFTALHAFSGGNDGGFATPGLVLGSNGVLYGATSSGGANGLGTVYQIVP